jgi:hypothetical protein
MRSPRKTNKNTSVRKSPTITAEAKMQFIKGDSRAKSFTRAMKSKLWHNWLTEENYFVNP